MRAKKKRKKIEEISNTKKQKKITMEIKEKIEEKIKEKIEETQEYSQIIMKIMKIMEEGKQLDKIRKQIQELFQVSMEILIRNGEKESECQNIQIEMKKMKRKNAQIFHMDKMAQNKRLEMIQRMKKMVFQEDKKEQVKNF